MRVHMCTRIHTCTLGISATTQHPGLYRKWVLIQALSCFHHVRVGLTSSLGEALAEEGTGREGSAGAFPGGVSDLGQLWAQSHLSDLRSRSRTL